MEIRLGAPSETRVCLLIIRALIGGFERIHYTGKDERERERERAVVGCGLCRFERGSAIEGCLFLMHAKIKWNTFFTDCSDNHASK